MTTATIPTTIQPGALELAREYGVERELKEILEEGRRRLAGLRAFAVESEPPHDMGGQCIVVEAVIDPAYADEPSFVAWSSWRIDRFGLDTGTLFLLTDRLERAGDER